VTHSDPRTQGDEEERLRGGRTFITTTHADQRGTQGDAKERVKWGVVDIELSLSELVSGGRA